MVHVAVAILDDRVEPLPVCRTHVKADVIPSRARTMTDVQALGTHPSGGER